MQYHTISNISPTFKLSIDIDVHCYVLGEKNECYSPEATLSTLNLVKEAHPDQNYTRFVIPDYGHLDCIYGKNAARDVYPHILEALDQYAELN